MAKATTTTGTNSTVEGTRLAENAGKPLLWRKWGPYLSERSWGSVREDYSSSGNAWDFLSHDLARSKAYRWGEDGLAGICDRYQILNFSLALWNGKDSILKERAFGLTPAEGNHGEDLKEYYFYLDSTPTHSYMKYLYKYPQARFPYEELAEQNRRRGGKGFEYELLDTGVFERDRYFDVFVEYAKVTPEDLLIRIEAINRGDQPAEIHLLPQLWFRNTWAWGEKRSSEPDICLGSHDISGVCLVADDGSADPLPNLLFEYRLGERRLYGSAGAKPLFTNNETNTERIYGQPGDQRFVKDAFHRLIVNSEAEAVNADQHGTKAALHYYATLQPGESYVLRLRLTPGAAKNALADVDSIVAKRKREADEFYASIHPANATADERLVQRQALAGMLWSKMVYLFDVNQWLTGDNPKNPPPASRANIRNSHWRHLNSMRVLSMPDKWEYPWFAAWDLAFHSVALALIDPEFAKDQLWLMLFEQFQHPSGQIPAYEWEFSDLNPPVHGFAVWRVYQMEKNSTGVGDRAWLEKCFHKLLINFAWWVNKVDSKGNNVFEGGFLGLDNITVIDRSVKLPDGAILEQSDGTGWMGNFCLSLMRIALELSQENQVYECLATKFFEHYVYIGSAMNHMAGGVSLWDDEDGFFYDILRYPNGSYEKFRVRSMVGIVPLFACEQLTMDMLLRFPEFKSNFDWFLRNRKDLTGRCCHFVEKTASFELTVASESQLVRLLERLFDPKEFLSDYGVRSLSKFHEKSPFLFGLAEVTYEPAESSNKIKGGNSNWRGPIWMPTAFLVVDSLCKLDAGYGDLLRVHVPGEEGAGHTPGEMAREISNRLIRIFTRDESGKRPVYGGNRKFQEDPHWRDYILFHEYFHGDNGAGLGASHQTGWTGLLATLIAEWRT